MIDLKDIIEDKDIHEVYLARYRADYVARQMWRLAKGRTHWQMMKLTHRDAAAGGSISARGAGSIKGARYLPVRIPACAVLGLQAQELRLWSTDYRAALRSLHQDELDAWEDYLLTPRLSAVFHLVARHAMMRRSPSAPPALAGAAMKIGAAAKGK